MTKKSTNILNKNVDIFLICLKYVNSMRTNIMPASYYKQADKLYQINKVRQEICYIISKIRDD